MTNCPSVILNIDVVVYLASLVSEPKAIDPLLDELRIVTANLALGAKLSERDYNSLNTLQHKLEDYLIHEEPLRTFTAENLRMRIDDHFRSAHKRLLWLLVGTWVGFVASYGLGMLLARNASAVVRPQVALSMALAFLYTAIVAFYVSALKEFKPGLRRAYAVIVVGIIFTGVSVLQVPLNCDIWLRGLTVAALRRLPAWLRGVVFFQYWLAWSAKPSGLVHLKESAEL